MPTEGNTESFDPGTAKGRKIVAAFDGGRVTSDAGAAVAGRNRQAIAGCVMVVLALLAAIAKSFGTDVNVDRHVEKIGPIGEIVELRLDGNSYYSRVSPVAFLDSRSLLTTGADNNTLRRVDVMTGKEVARINVGELSSFRFCSDGRLLEMRLYDTVRLIEVANGEQVFRATQESELGGLSPDCRFLLVYGGGVTYRLVDRVTGKEVTSIASETVVWAVAFSSDSRLLAVSAGEDFMGRLIETGSGKEVASIPDVTELSFSVDGRFLAVSDRSRTARVIETGTGKEVARIAHDATISAASFSPDGRWLATETGKWMAPSTVRVTEVASGRELTRMGPIRTYKKLTDFTTPEYAFSPDSRWLAIQGEESTVLLIETATGREVARIAHAGAVDCVSFSPDSRLLVSGDNTGGAVLVETATGKEVARISISNGVQVTEFSPDGRVLAMSTRDGSVRLLHVNR